MQPFRTILFAADFSENSKEAFRLACSLAIDNKTRLVVLHVAEPNFVPELPVPYGQPAVQFFPAEADKAHHEVLRQKLAEVYTPIQPRNIEYLTREGDRAAEIVKVATEIGSDVIAMGTHGRTGLRWLLAGSVAVSVLHGSPCSVLALRSAEQPCQAGAIRVIVHPTDFSVNSQAALWVARGLARDHAARLILLHVASLEFLTDGTPAAIVDPHAERLELERLRKRVDGPDLKYPVETVMERGYAAPDIIDTADELNCDLIVMGTHGRTGLGRLLMGSVAENVLSKANCPVLVVKAGERVSAPAENLAEPELLSVR